MIEPSGYTVGFQSFMQSVVNQPCGGMVAVAVVVRFPVESTRTVVNSTLRLWLKNHEQPYSLASLRSLSVSILLFMALAASALLVVSMVTLSL